MCEIGTIDSAATLAKGVPSTCSAGNWARTIDPGEHVPRMPSTSQVPVGSSECWSEWVSAATWSPGSDSGARRSVVSRSSA